MSELKFACPVCGQHITCDSSASGTPMDCPTCFRKLVVPQGAAGGSSNLILAAAQVSNRAPASSGGTDLIASRASTRGFPWTTVALVLLLGAVIAGMYFFRDRILPLARSKATPATPPPRQKSPPPSPAVPSAPDPQWTLQLGGKQFPDVPAAGRINGNLFQVQRATLQGGTLNLRESSSSPLGLGVTVYLFANQGEDLAGKSIHIETNRNVAPRVAWRWKEEGRTVTRNHREGYALRIEFGPVADGKLPGKIYLCTPDEAWSYVAGHFKAEIRKVQPKK